MKRLAEDVSRAGLPANDTAVIMRALEQSTLLLGFGQPDIEWVAGLARLRRFSAGADVFTESEPCEGLWIVASGHIRLYHSFAEGRQQVVGFMAAGSSLDLGTAIDGRAHAASATAMDDACLVLISRESLREIAARYPAVMRNAIWQLCVEVRQHDVASAVATAKDARGRISCALLQLARQFGVPSGNGIKIDYRLTRQDVADRAGVRIETAIRVLSDLQRQGVIRTRSQVIEIIDHDRLQTPAACDECLHDCSVFGDRTVASEPRRS